MKISIKNIIFAIIALAISVVLYNWYINCWKDHSKTLKKIGRPMQYKVMDFHTKHQRYPSLEESIELMENSGCLNVKQRSYIEKMNDKGEIFQRRATYNCDFGSMKFGYGLFVGDLSVKHNTEPYGFGFSEGKTRCSASFKKNGGLLTRFRCLQFSCIKGWGH